MRVPASVTVQLENISEGKDVELTVYDVNGNYVGTAKDCGKGCKKLTIPDYKGCPNDFIIRVTGTAGKETDVPSYRIKIKENWGETVDAGMEISEIQSEEYQALPDWEKYHGGESMEELLEKWASGEKLSIPEKNYLQIFANLSDYERAEAAAYRKNTLYPKIEEELQEAGILPKGEWNVEIDIYGKVSVKGDMEQKEKEAVEAVIIEKFAEELWENYMKASDISKSEYRHINACKEVNDFIEKATGGAYGSGNIIVDRNGKITGLPQEMCGLLNSKESNARYEKLRDDIYMLMDLQTENHGLQDVLGMSATFLFDSDGSNSKL